MGLAEIVVAFVGERRIAKGSDDDDEEVGTTVVASMWFHISEHPYSPWLSAYHLMECSVALDPAVEPPLQGQPRLNAKWLRKFFMLDMFDLTLRWHMLTFEAVFPGRMLGTFLPNTLDVVLVPETGYHLVWDPWKRKGSKKKAVVPAAWAEMLEQFDDEPSEDAADQPASDGTTNASSGSDAGHESDGDDQCSSVHSSQYESVPSELIAGLSDGQDPESSGESVCELLEYIPDDEDEHSASGDDVEIAAPVEGVVLDGPPPVVGDDAGDEGDGKPIIVEVGEGPVEQRPTIVWYRSGTFYAYCRGFHGNCRCNRKSVAGKRVAQGRPLGFLFWWLQQSREHGTAEEHLHDCYPSKAERRAAREDLRRRFPESRRLFKKERPKRRPVSDSEPDDAP